MTEAKIKKAIFPVAGLGTRFLPATKAMPKELLPIVDKPLIQYAAEEAIAANIETLIFVTGRNKRAIEDHFDNNLELEAALRKKGMDDKANMVRNILPEGVECIFVRQAEQLGLGHAVLSARRAVGNEPFAVLLADDFIVPDGKSITAELVERFWQTGKSQLSVMPIDGPSISKYGVVKPGQEKGSIVGLVEKPEFSNAPSNLASIGRYVLTSDIFEILKSLFVQSPNELHLADAINIQALSGSVEAQKMTGKRFDCGSKEGYVDAIIHMHKNF